MTTTDSTIHTIAVILAIIAAVLILAVGVFSPVLRESPTGGAAGKAPYSFARLQLFLWTLVILPIFSLHWGNCSCVTITETCLVLLGISSGTTVTAAIVTTAQLGAGKIALKVNRQSVNFWTDILTDDHGNFSVVRLQQLVFTLVFIGIFITEYFATKDYPVFNPTVYTLMGISAGSFVVGKGLNI
jgi:hypothetical protein